MSFRGQAIPTMVDFRGEVDNAHMSCLILFTLRWDGTQTVSNFISFKWNVFSFNVGNMQKDVNSSIIWCDKAMAFGSTEVFHLSFNLWV